MNTVSIIAHNGNFHADDVFAVATILLVLEHSDFSGWRDATPKIIRTRDPAIIKTGDFVVDVGGFYDEENNRFDHHQVGGAGIRSNGIPYASFGLVWKKYGPKLCGSLIVADLVEHKLVMPIDGTDNGIDMFEPVFPDVTPYTVYDFLYSYFPTWKDTDTHIDEVFLTVVNVAREMLRREIKNGRDNTEARLIVEESYHKSQDKRIIILDKSYPAEVLDVLQRYPEPLFVIRPDEQNATWKANAVRKNGYSFENKKNFPESWAGKRDSELAKASGIADAVFCHNKLFLAVAHSKEGALELAKKAINA
ncbi:MAG: metal-dependent protein hydrolase [Candidatus Paceibacter sp.]|jgi:uncharacterized UPF0160 family protein|nr:metal-dependent protein hydrolase [Candidatus Paceibacter sp.]